MDFRKEQIRILVSNLYDLQKMRISVGNRLVQSIYMQMGVKPGASPENVKAALIKYYNDSRDISLLEAAMTGKDKIETVDSEGNKKTIVNWRL